MSDKLKPNPCCGLCKHFRAVTGQGLYDDYDGYCHIDGTDVDTTSYCEQFEPCVEHEGLEVNKDILRETIEYIIDECSQHKNCVECKFFYKGEWHECLFSHPPTLWNEDFIEEAIKSREVDG